MYKLFEVLDDTLVDAHAEILHSAAVASENDGRTVVGDLTLGLCVAVTSKHEKKTTPSLQGEKKKGVKQTFG